MTGPEVDRLLHITDLHFWEVVFNPLHLMNKRALGNINVALRRRREYLTSRGDAYAAALAEKGAPVLFAGGDFTSTATEREFADAARFIHKLRGHGMQVVAVPGNHDVYTFESVRRRRFERHFGAYCPDEALPCRITLPGGTPMVLAPTARARVLSSKGHITEAEAAEAARLVAEAPPGPVLVGAHYPVLHKTHAYSSSPSRRLTHAGYFRAALGETKRRILYLSGHVHRFSLTRDPDHENLCHLTTSAFFMHKRKYAHEGAFSEVRVLQNGFRVFQHWYEGGWKQREAEPRGI